MISENHCVHEMVKHINNSSATADELFEYVWPFCVLTVNTNWKSPMTPEKYQGDKNLSLVEGGE